MLTNLKFAVLDRISDRDLEITLLRRRNLKMQLEDNRFYFHDSRSKKAERACEGTLFRDSFTKATLCVEHQISGYDSKKQIELLQSFRKIVSMDLSYSNIALFIYQDERKYPGAYFPFHYFDKEGNNIKLRYEKKRVCMYGKYVVEVPYSTQKWLEHLERKDNLCAEKYRETLPYYYPELDMIVQGGGCIHRTAEAFIHREDGTAMVRQYDTSVLYNNITTDGASWISVHDEQIIGPIGDYRFALVFWLKQREELIRINKTSK